MNTKTKFSVGDRVKVTANTSELEKLGIPGKQKGRKGVVTSTMLGSKYIKVVLDGDDTNLDYSYNPEFLSYCTKLDKVLE